MGESTFSGGAEGSLKRLLSLWERRPRVAIGRIKKKAMCRYHRQLIFSTHLQASMAVAAVLTQELAEWALWLRGFTGANWSLLGLHLPSFGGAKSGAMTDFNLVGSPA